MAATEQVALEMARWWTQAHQRHEYLCAEIREAHEASVKYYKMYGEMEDKLTVAEKEMLTYILDSEFLVGLTDYANGDIEEPEYPTFMQCLEQTPFIHLMSDLCRRRNKAIDKQNTTPYMG
jgi:hypothetical protein